MEGAVVLLNQIGFDLDDKIQKIKNASEERKLKKDYEKKLG